MKKILLTIVLISTLNMFGFSDSEKILQQLQSDSEWQAIKQNKSSRFRRKPLEGYDLYALEISREVSVSPEAVFAVLLDVASYPEVLAGNDLLEAEEVKRESEKIVGYQFARLPLVSNRHYLFSFDLASWRKSLESGKMGLHWTLLEPEGFYSSFIENKNRINNDPVYIANGAGLWQIRELDNGNYENIYRLYLDPAGWMPGWLVNSFNLKNLEQLFDRVIAAAEKRR